MGLGSGSGSGLGSVGDSVRVRVRVRDRVRVTSFPPRKVLRRIALEYLLYEESGATCWDTMIDVRKRPEWLKVLGVGLWSRVATPTPTPTLNRNPTLTQP